MRFFKEVMNTMVRKLKVLFVSSECGPYARTGGLGDVASSLPDALSKDENISIRRVMPLYRSVKGNLKYKTDFSVPMGDGYQNCIIKCERQIKKVPTYFIGNDWYFNRNDLYGYFDDGERFLYFCKAVVEMISFIGFRPDIIHCNDWHTAFIPLLAKMRHKSIKTMYTIHNLVYTGFIPANYLSEYEISKENLEMLGFPDNLNFIKAGLAFSDHITTVSKGYAAEILTPQYGAGLDNLTNMRKNSISGILNGIDTDMYNPESAIVPFNMDSIDKKAENKALLRKELNLMDSDLPVVSAVTRLDEQKGIGIIINALRKTDLENFQFVLLGTGNMYYENTFSEMASMYLGRMAFIPKFNPTLASRIYAGSDILIMPSKFEPGGLSQLYAMAYGTVPVVRNTGGLKDTVIDEKDDFENANGFCFDSYTVSAFLKALNRAIAAYKTPRWQKLMKNGMALDKSWKNSAAEYAALYRNLAGQRKPIQQEEPCHNQESCPEQK